MGSIRRRGKGWVVRYDKSPGPNGERRQGRKQFSTRDEARDALKDLESEAKRGLSPPDERYTVREYLEKWLTWTKGRVGPRTYAGYEAICRLHIIPGLGNVRLEYLSPLQIEEYLTTEATHRLDGREGRLSNRTLLHQYRVLSVALKRAVVWRLIHSNPCESVEPPRPARTEARALSAPQLRGVLEDLRGNWLYLPAALAALAGLRRGEVCGLKWSDIDLAGGYLVVSRSIGVVNGKCLELPPKAGSSGIVALPPILVETLQLARMEAPPGDGWVVTGPDGGRVHPKLLSTRWFWFCRQRGLMLSFHQLRHTQGALLVSAGAHEQVQMKQMRHKSPAMRLHYGHVVDDAQADAAVRIDRLVRGDG